MHCQIRRGFPAFPRILRVESRVVRSRSVLRLGCCGCLTVLILATLAAGAAWGVFQVTRDPAIAGAPTSPADGLRAQQKIFDIVRRAGDGRPRAISLSERELNAFLGRHLGESADLPLRNLAVRLPSDGLAEVAGQVPLRQLLSQAPFSALNTIVPANWLERSVWLAVRTRVTVETSGRREPRRLRLDVERFWLGRLPMPEVMLRVLLDPAALRVLRSPIAETIESIRIEPGRLIIQARHSST